MTRGRDWLMDYRIFAWRLLWRIEHGSKNSRLCQLSLLSRCRRPRRVTNTLRDSLMRLLPVRKVGYVTHQLPQIRRRHFSLQVICKKHAQSHMRNGWQVSCNLKASLFWKLEYWWNSSRLIVSSQRPVLTWNIMLSNSYPLWYPFTCVW